MIYKDQISPIVDNTSFKNMEEHYSPVPRLSDTRYSAKGTKGKWRYASEIKMRYLPVISIYGYVGGRQI